MKNSSTVTLAQQTKTATVVGLDLGDRRSAMCVLVRRTGEVLERSEISTSPAGIRGRFEGFGRTQIVLETGTHSPWVSELLAELGHEVLVANARQVSLIYQRKRKNDRVDAETLARLARVDVSLLAPVRHRGRESREHLGLVRSRAALMQARTKLVNHCRGLSKSLGERIAKCSTEAFARRAGESLSPRLVSALSPALEVIATITTQIRSLDEQLETLSREHYPQHTLLTQVGGVGTLTAMTFLLTIEDPDRFPESRAVGPYLGLAPGQDESGDCAPQKRITKEGDAELRRLLVQCAHSILGRFGKDCDLRRHGLKIAERGGKNAKKRAAVAVARKLAILLLQLWRTGEVYEPLRNAERATETRRADVAERGGRR